MPLVGPEGDAWSDLQAWAGLLVVAAIAYLAARIVTGLGLAVAFVGWRRSEGSHWTERARRAWPGRQLARWVGMVVPYPLLFGLVGPPGFADLGRSWSFSPLIPTAAKDLLLIVAASLGVIAPWYAWVHRVNPASALTPRTQRGTWTFRGVTLALWIWLPFAMFGRVLIARAEVWVAVVGIGLLLIAAYRFGGVRFLFRRTGLLRPAPDRLLAIVGATSERMGIRPRSVEVVAIAQANAFAFPLSGRILVTDSILAVLDDDELTAVVAHELAHLAEPRRVAIARLAHHVAVFVLFALPLLGLALMAWDPAFSVVILFVVPAYVFACGIGTRAYSRMARRMEVQADAMAAAVESGPGIYARALETIHRANAVPVVLAASRGPHPDLYDRMIAAGLEPDYPRPAPPSGWAALAGLVVMVIGSIAGGFGLVWMARTIG